MIHILTKSRLFLYIIIIFLIILTVVGFVCCQCEAKRTISTLEDTIDTNKNTIDIEIDKEGDSSQAVEPVNLGVFKLTAYCSCGICCGKWANNRPTDEYGNEIVYGAIGERLKEGYSIAVDPNVIPYRTEVLINGDVYKAQDCGGGIKGNEIDVYFEDHNKALEFGVQYIDVFVKI